MFGRYATATKTVCITIAGLLSLALPQIALAHDPIFGLGPHVIYEGGVELSSQFDAGRSARSRNLDVSLLNIAYGINADVTIGSELPWVFKKNSYGQANGLGDLGLFTKYRFWHVDSPGKVDAMAALLKVKFNTSKQRVFPNTKPPLGSGSSDLIAGLSYGHESLTWYRWASLRYRYRGKSGEKKPGDKIRIDLAAGWRPTMPEYLKPDMVWLLELNGEYSRQGRVNGIRLANDGGTELFLSPGFMWTVRNIAVRAGIQLPLYSNLHGTQATTSYRARVQLEWHL